MTAQVVILGAGFGGLELSARLAEDLVDEVDVTLIDRNDSFVFGFAKLDVMFGHRSPDEVRLYYRDIAKPNVQFRQETVLSVDPQARQVVTDRATYDADILVVALGADLDPDATPGLVEGVTSSTHPRGPNASRCCCPASRPGSLSSACWGRSSSVRRRRTRPLSCCTTTSPPAGCATRSPST